MLDQQRLEFSRSLPPLLHRIAYAMVFRGSGQMLYRVMPDPKRGGDSGWWLCLELDVNVEAQELRLSVKSCHYRTTRPEAIRGIKSKFFAFFNPMYRALRKRHSWLQGQEKTKAPH